MIPALVIIGGLAYAGYRARKERLEELSNNSQSSLSEIPQVGDKTNLSVKQPASSDLDALKQTSIVEENIITDESLMEEVDHYLKISSASLGFAVAGALLYPPLTLICIPFALSSAIPVFKNAFVSVVEEKKIRGSVVESLAIAGTLANRCYITGGIAAVVYFLGNKLLLKTEDNSKKELINIFGQHSRTVWMLKEDIEIEVPVEEVESGDIIVLQAGQIVPIDGRIIKGIASVDQRILTGESQLVEKESGDIVLASTLIIRGKIQVEVVDILENTVASQIAMILQNTADFKSSAESKAIKFADMMAAPTLALGGITWALMGPVSATAMVACNFVETIRINIPLGVLNFLKLASEKGILVKDGRCLELLHDVDTVVFDKTGTLTLEEPEIGKVHVLGSLSEEEIVMYAAAAEQKQSHPVARCVVRYAKKNKIEIPAIEDINCEIGYGIKVNIGSDLFRVGSERFMVNENISGLDTQQIEKIKDYSQKNGYALVYIAQNSKLAGAVELHTTIRPEARKIIKLLKSKGIATCIISGDHEAPTQKLADELAIERYFASVLPEDKAKIIQELQAQSKSVCFVGDGINDTLALKTSNVSISIQGASTAALDTAGIVLMDGTLNHLPDLIDLAHEMAENMRNSFGTALVPGAIGAAGVFLFNFKIFSTVMLFMASLGAGTFNAMLPVLKHRDNRVVETSVNKEEVDLLTTHPSELLYNESSNTQLKD